jgi:hypothetical protein
MIGERRAQLLLPVGLAGACAVLGWGLYAQVSAPIGQAEAKPEAAAAPLVQPLPPAVDFTLAELAAYHETLARPLFSAQRRPDAATPAPAASPQAIDLILRGVILNGEARIALFISAKDSTQVQLKQGESYRDWTLTEVAATEATFQRGAERQKIAILYDEPPPRPAAAPRAQTPDPRGAATRPSAAPAVQPQPPRQGQNTNAAPPQAQDAAGRAALRQRLQQQLPEAAGEAEAVRP